LESVALNTSTATKEEVEAYNKRVETLREKFKEKGVYSMKNNIDSLLTFQNKVTPKLFIHIYGERMGMHFAQTFVDMKMNILSLYQQMDIGNKMYLLYRIASNTPEEDMYIYA